MSLEFTYMVGKLMLIKTMSPPLILLISANICLFPSDIAVQPSEIDLVYYVPTVTNGFVKMKTGDPNIVFGDTHTLLFAV